MKPLSEYPRPQLIRDSYLCLNGEWEYAIRKEDKIPDVFDGKILVPFSPEMEKSGVHKKVSPTDFLYYKLEFDIPSEYLKDKILLHFGAVDQIAEVYLNDKFVGKHIGGFLPFEFDIKPYIKNTNILIVKVRDFSDTSHYSRGKQRIHRGGIWYTAQSGIYMPVWIESVNNGYIKNLVIEPNIDTNEINITIVSDSKKAEIDISGNKYTVECNKKESISIKDPQLWSPENPFLYNFTVKVDGDIVNSYFAMRKFSAIKDNKGYLRLALNNKPYFMKGVLDQGYYKEGSLTHSSDEDYIKDIELMKRMGFNTLRKHIKIESLRWYYHCDRIGMIVWQDFVSGGEKYKLTTISLPLITNIHHKDNKYSSFGRKNKEGRELVKQEFRDTINLLYNCPCIGLWTIFNEGWGQFDSAEIYKELRELDKTRLFDHASGWHDQGVSDTKSLHVYFKRVKMPKEKEIKNRSVILSECGGYTLPIKDHMFSNKKFGYKKIKNAEDLVEKYRIFIEKDVICNVNRGLSAFIYTQLSDVEDELNGFVTYDRKVIKVKEKSIEQINELVHY